jgi:zinc transporter ZupT
MPVAAGVFAWAGFTYMTTGVVDERTKAKNMIQKVFLGFVFILAAWLLVSTILNALLADEFKNAVPVELNQ